MIAVLVRKVHAECQAALPRNAERLFRNAELRCYIVLISAADRTVNGENPWLNFTCFVNDSAKIDILSVMPADPAGIKPENIQLAVIFAELQHLILCIFFKTVPNFRVLLRIVGWSAGCQSVFSKLLIPVVRAVPVCFGEVSADADTFLAECIKHGFYDIRIFVLMERAVLCGCLIIGIFRIPQAESVVMLCGQNQIAESAILCHLCPLLRLETDRVERTVQIKILFFERFSVCPVYLVAGPVRILVA